jgi:PAS domain S-box-containing protein
LFRTLRPPDIVARQNALISINSQSGNSCSAVVWFTEALSLAGYSVEIQSSEKRKTLPSLDQEVPFSFAELFFSRTDARGVIISGNSVFQRISMYSWDELINKPHNIIRHPDMPRAVFWLLWETIKKGEPIGAYVKNRAKDGRYYWVFAIVTPVEQGYLSVRLKPSALLPIVDGEYKSLVAAATKNKLSPKDSAAILLERLAQLGFQDYGAFMAAALGKELAARAQHLRREPDRMIGCFDELLAAANSLLDQAGAIFEAYAKNKYIPLNLRVQAAQLADAGVAIGAISSNYNVISAAIKDNMSQFIASAQQVLRTINNGLFLLCVAKVQQEVAEFFSAESSSGKLSHEQEMISLQQQQRAYQRKAVDGLRAITERAERFQQDFTEMKRLAASLEVTRVMGKMESSRLAVARDGLDELIDDLESFQTAIADGLRKIERLNWSIRSNAGRLLEIMAS